MKDDQSTIIGIDLGTSNSAVTWFSQEGPTLIASNKHKRLLPSVVGLDDNGHILVGEAAKTRLVSHPHLTVASFKRYMGTDKAFTLNGQKFRAEELSALILRRLKTDAEVELGCTITRAVITVPAYFNDLQRKAVKIAGQMAGLNVERLLNEPTAAALAYGIAESREQKFLIFDLGGGTFDVSIIDMFDGVIEVRASSGDAWLGGDDFTEALRQWMISRYPDLELANSQLSASLTQQAEELKRQLSSQERASVKLIHAGTEYHWELNESILHECCRELLSKLKKPVLQALRDAQFDVNQLDHVILVGGATRMPLIRQLVTRMFNRFPHNELNPDEVVALGAGVQAGLMAEDCALDDIVLTDVMPYSLGIATARCSSDKSDEQIFCPLIERNAFVPVSVMQTFCTITDYQRQIAITVYQGESRKVSDNLLLDKMLITIPARKAGEISIDVRFTYTLDGILEVECKVIGQETVWKRVIEKTPGMLSEEEIAQRLKALNNLKQHPRDLPANRELIVEAAKRYEQALGEGRQIIDYYSTQFELALEKQDLRLIASTKDELRRILDQLNGGR